MIRLRAVNNRFEPVLELTHNHGTEAQDGPVYHNGNTDPVGFSHVGYTVENISDFAELLDKDGVSFVQKIGEGVFAKSFVVQ
eukprot:gene9503-3038_t